MENIRTTVEKIQNLLKLLQTNQEKLVEKGESDPSSGSTLRTIVAVDQLKKKLDIVLGSKENTEAENSEMEVCENEQSTSK
jgi:hypothetical protein